MMDKKAELAAEIIKEYQRLAADRGTLDSHLQEIAMRVMPSHSNLFTQNGHLSSRGDKRNGELYDSTAAIALGRFGAILDSLLTPRNQTWHRLTTNDRSIAKNRDVKLYFEQVNQILFKFRYSPKANFSAQNQQNYKSLGAYGTGCLFIDDLDGGQGIRYKSNHLSEVFFAENHQGIVDKVYRYFSLSARQAFQKWGEIIPPMMKDALKIDGEKLYYFIHCVKPRQDVDYQRKDFKGMPYASYYVAMEGKAMLSEGGYSTFPYAVSRYEQAPGEIYGRSPAMDVLPAIKTLNEEKKTILKQGHRIVDPVLLAHDDGIIDSFSLKPGAINYGGVSKDGQPLVHVLPTGNVQIGKELMDDERSIINDAFLVTLFQILAETPQMTATEVLERTREKGILLAPTIGRQQDEYLGPMIERELDILARQGVLPPMPQLLVEAKGEYQIVYDSPLSKAQRADEASGLMRSVESALQVVNVTQNVGLLDYYDWDTIIPEMADIQGVPTRWMKDPRIVQVLRQQRAEAEQAQQAIQAAPAAAAMVKAGAVANKKG